MDETRLCVEGRQGARRPRRRFRVYTGKDDRGKKIHRAALPIARDQTQTKTWAFEIDKLATRKLRVIAEEIEHREMPAGTDG